MMGKELDRLLFSNPEFRLEYERFSRELEEHLDEEFRRGRVNPLKYYRMKAGMTRHQLADIIGVSVECIREWEDDTRR